MNLYHSFNLNVECAYIIRVKDNEKSESLAKRCVLSCDYVKMPYVYWDAYDGTGNEIIPPANLKDHVLMNMIRIDDHYMKKGEVACFLSHISLWSRCVEIDKPIVILEHDAIMIKPYYKHVLYNSICYLGSHEQYKNNWNVYPTPPHGSDGPNYHFILRAHAYAIDPAIARHLLSHVLRYGMSISLDQYIKADIFPMHQFNLFAYDEPSSSTTIKNRPGLNEGRPNLRNDDLKE
jgi:hypothetical protein